MQTLQINIPDDLAEKIGTQKSEIEKSIVEFLRSVYLNKKIPLTLEEEYQHASLENKVINKEFESIDMEGWDNEY